METGIGTQSGSRGWQEGTGSQKGLQRSKGRSFLRGEASFEEKLPSSRDPPETPAPRHPYLGLPGRQELEHVEKLAHCWELLQLLDYQEGNNYR